MTTFLLVSWALLIVVSYKVSVVVLEKTGNL